MIKIQQINAPDELTDEVKKKLTEEYKRDNTKAVWDKKYIRNNLLIMSHSKCCYCECFIGTGKKEMHIDHFKPKKLYPDLVVEWDNLLPSCPYCNKSKSEHDTGKKIIINPKIDNPKEYFYLKLYRYCSKSSDLDSIGRRTIEILNLNDSDRHVLERYTIGNEIQNKLEELYEYTVEHEEELPDNTRRKNRIVNTCRDILKRGLDVAEFSAFMATIIHNDSNYKMLKSLLEEKGLWSEELEILHNNSKRNKFDTERNDIER